MYIFELIKKCRKKKNEPVFVGQPAICIIKEEKDDEPEICRHILVPIDSTKKVLACSKCGFVIRRENLPKRTNNVQNSANGSVSGNFFKKD